MREKEVATTTTSLPLFSFLSFLLRSEKRNEAKAKKVTDAEIEYLSLLMIIWGRIRKFERLCSAVAASAKAAEEKEQEEEKVY